jgi:hypothetical protein
MDPEAYLRQVLIRIDELLPWNLADDLLPTAKDA